MNPSDSNRELVITRDVDVPADKLFQGWTDPELLKQWFCPKPWGVSRAELDVRPRLVPGRDAQSRGPGVSESGRLSRSRAEQQAGLHRCVHQGVGTVRAAVHDRHHRVRGLGGGRTRYTARARHRTVADREKHEAMGFHDGWNKALDQLLELVGKH